MATELTEADADIVGEDTGAEQGAGTDETDDPKRLFQEQLIGGLVQLDETVSHVGSRVDEIADFVVRARDALFRDAEELTESTRFPLLESLFRVHDTLFQRAQAMEAGDCATDHFVATVLASIEGELGRHGVEVLCPAEASTVSWDLMQALRRCDTSEEKRLDTVARVHRCGFALHSEETRRVLRKAEVDVYGNEEPK